MQMEEVLFFPAARKSLTPEDWASLEAASRKGDDPLFGDEKHEIYKALYQEIMEWGKAGQGAPETGETASHSG
jgi:hemerythrin-like domain-containing protein